MNATHMLQLAVQAAQGLYQIHLYKDGKATHVHADIKPSQFLLFEPDDPTNPPILQLNDFNRGQFLTKSRCNNETCPFFVCGVTHKGSRYRSPEEYSDCAEQRDSIDVYSLGGVFYFLLSDGMKPWYYIKSFDSAVKEIQKGRQSSLPPADAYEEAFGENVVAHVKERSSHPAFLALKEVMEKCWAFKPTDRPSSLQVVEMLKAKIHGLNL
jgi:serine/threonine protein kinase